MRELPMTPGEIVTSYRQAANKKEQIKILSQLNACPPEEIKQVLVENGVDILDLPVMRKRWTMQEEARLRQLAAEGLTAEQIGREMICTEKAVREKAERMHVSIRPPDEEKAGVIYPDVNPIIHETMEKTREEAKRRMNTMLDRVMANETEAPITVPDLPLAATSREKREQKSWTPEEEELLLKLVAEGRDHQEIGEALHRSEGSIKHKLKHIRAVGLKAKAGEFQPPAETSRRLSVDDFQSMVTSAIGQELHAGAEARLVDMLSALGYMVMKYFAGGQEHGHE